MPSGTLTSHQRAFVGRGPELRGLDELRDDDGRRIGYVHGIAGIGKSALLDAFVLRSRDSGASLVVVDCRTVEPTERGALLALGGAGTVEQLHRLLEALPPPVVLVMDHCEVFRLMDTWLRQVLVPALPVDAKLVLAGRLRPVAGWFSVAGFSTLPLGPLDAEDSRLLLAALDVPAGHAERLNRVARGHPLALTLASAGLLEQPRLSLEDAAMSRVVEELALAYLNDVPDPRAREALEAASLVRRATAPVMSAMLPGADGDETLGRLLQQPFVDTCRDGLVVHDAVKDAIAGLVHGANPLRYLTYRRAAWRELQSESRDAAPGDLWRYTADMLYLIDNPVVREAFFPSGVHPVALEPARADDSGAVRDIARRHEVPAAAAVLERWWAAAPETFSVVRRDDGVVAGFFALLRHHQIRRPPVTGDTVVDSWARDLHDHPLPPGQVALGLRRWLDVEHGERPCATQAACWLDTKRTYLALRPQLRRMYVVVEDVATYWPIVEELGFRPLAGAAVEFDGHAYASVVLDFGSGSVDGWLSALVGAQLGISAGHELDEEARELSVRGKTVALTPLEFGLFRHLRDREGRPVTRGQLLLDVWGTDFTGGSNVVDAVVRTLRRKLGPAGVAIETVRGSGYRLRPDWRTYLS